MNRRELLKGGVAMAAAQAAPKYYPDAKRSGPVSIVRSANAPNRFIIHEPITRKDLVSLLSDSWWSEKGVMDITDTPPIRFFGNTLKIGGEWTGEGLTNVIDASWFGLTRLFEIIGVFGPETRLYCNGFRIDKDCMLGNFHPDKNPERQVMIGSYHDPFNHGAMVEFVAANERGASSFSVEEGRSGTVAVALHTP